MDFGSSAKPGRLTHAGWNPKFFRNATVSAPESFWSYSDDCKRLCIDPDGRPKHLRNPTESVPPEVINKNYNRAGLGARYPVVRIRGRP